MNGKSILLVALGALLGGACSSGGKRAVADADASTLTASVLTTVADGTSRISLSVVARTAKGKPIPDRTVTLTVTGTSNAVVAPGTTDLTGMATGSLASTVAETKVVRATIEPEGIELSQVLSLDFLADETAISPTLSEATASSVADVVADGAQVAGIDVIVRDVNGNVVPDQEVSLSVSGSDNTIAQPAMTDATGSTSGSFQSTRAESKVVTVTVNPGPGAVVLADTPTIGFIGDATTISATLSTASAVPSIDVTANGVALSIVGVTVRDTNSNPVEGQVVQLATSGAGNTLTQPAATTNAAGVANGILQSTLAEVKTLTATINPGPDQVVVTTQPTVGFIGDAGNLSASLSTVVVAPDSWITADGLASTTATVTARDGNGNLVEDVEVALLASGLGNTIVQPANTDAVGVASGTLATTAAERKTLTARLDPSGAAVDVAIPGLAEFVWNRPNARYVRTSGADGNGGTGPLDAWATLSHAFANITAGETLYVGAGTYAEAVSLATSGTSALPIRLVADTSGAFCGDAGEVVVDAGGATHAFDLGTASFVHVEGFTLTGATAGAGSAAIRIQGSDVTVRDNEIYGNEQAIRVEGGTSWFGSHPFRREVHFGTDHDLLPAGFTVALSMDTQTGTTNHALANGDDLRVVWQPATGGFFELDRLGDVFDSAATTLRFRLQNDLAANADVDGDGSYFLYYGDDTASAAPADTTEVYWFDEGFDRADGTVIGNGWTEWNDGGDMGIVSGALVIQPTGDSVPPQVGIRQPFPLGAVPGDFRVSWSWDMPSNDESFWSFWGMNIGTAASMSNADRTAGVGVGLYNGEGLGLTGTEILSADMMTNLETGITGTHTFRLDVDVSGFTFDYWRNDTLMTPAVPFLNNQVVLDELRIGADSIGVNPGEEHTIDSIRVELIVGNDPEATEGVEESLPAANGDRVTVEHNRISGNADTAVHLGNSATSVVRNNLIYDQLGAGIVGEDGCSSLLIELNTLYGNADDQVRVAASGSDATVRDNVLAAGGADGIVAEDGAVIASSYNVLWAHTGVDWSGTSSGTGDLTLDPGLVDPDGADDLLGGANGGDDSFHLDPGLPSPAIDAGSGSADAMTFSDGGTASDWTSRTDGVLDGTGPDLATTNLGYHYPADVAVPGSLDTGDGRVLMAQAAERRALARAWDDTGSSWSSAERLPPGGGAIRWLVHALSPLANDEELVLVGSDASGTSELDILLSDATRWGTQATLTGVGDVDARGFDGAFEATTGDALVVWADGTSTPRYRTRVNGVWTDAASLPLNDGGGPQPDVNASPVRWLELVAAPNSDEIQLLYSDTDDDLVTVTWDGGAWREASAATLETGLKTNGATGTVDHRAFDAAFEQMSGDLVAVWSQEGVNGAFYATRSAGADVFSAPVALLAPAAGTPHFVDLASEPGTDQVALCALDLGDGVERLGLATWTGASWVDVVEADSQIRDANDLEPGDFMGGVAWFASTGTAVCVYADDDTGGLSWASWSSGSGWSLGLDHAVAGMGALESVQLARIDDGDTLLVVATDAAGDLRAFTFDGTTWTTTNGGATLASGVPTAAAVPLTAVGTAD